MSKKRALLFRGLAVLVLLAVAGLMFLLGRGHAVYVDNKTLDYNGQTYEAPYKVAVFVDGEQVAKLYEKERGAAEWMGQNFKMKLTITQEKGGDESTVSVAMKLPYGMDGVVINLPGLLAGLPQEAYISEFVSAIPQTEETEEPAVGEDELLPDEFAVGEF